MAKYQTIELDRTPANEASLTNRENWRPALAKLEATLFKNQIVEQFSKVELEAYQVEVIVKVHYGIFTDCEVQIRYNPESDDSGTLAYRIEDYAWPNWTGANKRILDNAKALSDMTIESVFDCD